MNNQDLSDWMHDHAFDAGSEKAERSTRRVMWITAVMMVIEIVGGWWYNSMALLADGWHMSSHAVAIGLSALAYATARKYATDPRFAFGTWKIEVLAGFASAIFLLGVAVMMVVGSVERLLSPQEIHYQEAMVVGVLGLLVNLVCAFLLGDAHHHDHGHSHGHSHEHPHPHSHPHPHGQSHQQQAQPKESHAAHHDLNLKSAYIHVIADAATSVLAIVALAGGWFYGWSWLDPVMGLLGAMLVAVWSKDLIVQTGKVLLDREMDHPVVDEIRAAVEADQTKGQTHITDLHVWRVGKNVYSCAMTVVTQDASLTPTEIRNRISVHEEVVHATIEVHRPA
jgi:cation diffusion facilitator family transporter